MLEPLEIGDVLLRPEGTRLRLEITDQQPEALWTVTGALCAIDYLQRWVAAQRLHDQTGVTP